MRLHRPSHANAYDGAMLEALEAVYDEARAAARPSPQFEAVPEQRRLAFLLKQRDSAMSKLIPPGGPR